MIFGNKQPDMGHVSPIAPTFDELVSNILSFPIELPYSRAEYMGWSKDERTKRKRNGYFIPASCNAAGCPRKTENAKTVSLVALDVDNDEDAERVLQLAPNALQGYASAIYHTASSIPAWPRVRVLVKASHLEPGKYTQAVHWLAQLLQVEANKESCVVVQPMYFPVKYKGDTESPLVYVGRGGAITGRLVEHVVIGKAAKPTEDTTDTGIEFVTAPLLGVKLDDAREMLGHIPASCSRAEWISVGAALKHQFGEEGFDLWNEWSATSDKYPEQEEMETQWGSLKTFASGNRASVTFRSIIAKATANGYEATTASQLVKRSVESAIARLKTAESVLHEGVNLVARESGNLLGTELQALAQAIVKAVHQRGGHATTTAVAKDIKTLALSLKKQSLLEGKGKEAKAGDDEVPAWARGLAYVAGTDEIFRKETGEKWKPNTFDSAFGFHFVPAGSEDFVPTVRPRDYVLNKVQAPKVTDYVYLPQDPSVIVGVKGKKFLNLYRPDYPEPDWQGAEEAGATFVAHIRHLIGEDMYGDLLLDWLTYLVQFPGEKITWAPVLQGVPGCGKTAIAVLMARALGESNVGAIQPRILMESSYNDWQQGKQFLVLEEVRVTGKSRHLVMDALKQAVTNESVTINRKYRDVYEVPNVTNYMVLTNHHDSIAIDENDRRYFVVESSCQFRADLRKFPDDYFKKLFAVDGGALRAWFLTRKIGKEFQPKGSAPQTHYRHDLTELTKSQIQRAIIDFAKHGDHALVTPDLVSITALRALLEADGYGKEVREAGFRTYLRDLGYFSLTTRIVVNGVRHELWGSRTMNKWSDKQIQEYIDLLE